MNNRTDLDEIIFTYVWVSFLLLLVAFQPEHRWLYFWVAAGVLALLLLIRLGAAIYDLGRKRSDKEDK